MRERVVASDNVCGYCCCSSVRDNGLALVSACRRVSGKRVDCVCVCVHVRACVLSLAAPIAFEMRLLILLSKRAS